MFAGANTVTISPKQSTASATCFCPEPYGRHVRLDPESQVAITDAFELVPQPAQNRNSVLKRSSAEAR
jgi:hypothetical protein